MRRFLRDDEGGQAIVLIVLVLLTLLFAIGLAFDAGELFNGRRTAQEAADAAAFAGAVVLYQNGTEAQATSAATADATLNGYSTGSPTGTTVTVRLPPTSGDHIGDHHFIEVIIATDVRTPLVPQEAGFTRVSARAVAGAQVIGNPYAVMAIAQTGNNTFTAGGGSTLVAQGGGVLVNSVNNGAAATSGGGIVTATGEDIDIVGGYSGEGWSPQPTTGVDVEADPLAGYPKPTTSGLSNQSCCATTISPGVYDGGISLSSGQVVVMEPGTYIMRGGGLSLTGSASLTGHGVFIFNTNSNYPATTGNCGAVTFAAQSVWDLSSSTSGEHKGMMLFQDPNCSATINLSGQGAGVSATGTIYAPNATVSLSGGNNFTMNSKIVAKNVGVSGGATFTINYVAEDNAQVPVPALVE